MRESDIRKRVVAALRPLHAQAVENPINPGTPDVEFVGGWMEIKYLKSWPKRPTTKVTVQHFTPQQRIWIRDRVEKGGKVLLLLRVDDEWMLFSGKQVDKIGTWTEAEMTFFAQGYWKRTFDPVAFLAIVKQLTNA